MQKALQQIRDPGIVVTIATWISVGHRYHVFVQDNDDHNSQLKSNLAA